MDKDSTETSVADMATLLKVSRPTIYKWKSDGTLQRRLAEVSGKKDFTPKPIIGGQKEECKEKKRNAKFEEAMAKINEAYGAGSVRWMDELVETERISSGLEPIDEILGGGIPRGRILEVYGLEGSGKTSLAIHIAAEFQKVGEVGFIDAEHALDLDYAEALGFKTSDAIISQPDNMEDGLEVAEKLIPNCSMIIIDSIASLVPKAEIEGLIGDNQMGLKPRIMGQAMRKFVPLANKSGCTVICLNQIRKNLGVVYGNPNVTPGGMALKFAATQRIEMTAFAPKSGEKKRKVRIKCVKNKVAPPYLATEMNLVFGKGLTAMRKSSTVADQ